MQLHGLNALVTGASRGLGRSLALELARHGARVALVARDEAALDRVVAELRAGGATAHGIVADVADKDAAHRIAGAAAGALGEVDLLVHNASALGPLPMPPLLDTHCEDLARVLEVNLVGPFRLTRALAGSMALRRRGTVLFVSSDAAVEPYPGWGAYGVSKAAADHLARVWAEELRPAGVTVAAIDPGEMDTQMHADALPDADRASLARPDDVARVIARALREGRLETGRRVTASSLAVAA
jgi:NAD(P)-dependent dehydrogenase (short-subunit alcohol dehydrogenase family)